MLRGSLDTFALPDVLTLLAGTAKSGELRVNGSAGEGRVWLDRGQVVGAEAGAAPGSVAAVVRLLRLEEGEFAFEADVEAPDPGPAVAVEEVLAAAAEQLAEWREIEAVLPSPAALVALVPEAPKNGVRVSSDLWRAIVAVGEGRPVEDVVAALAGDELAAHRTLKALVDAGLATVEAATGSVYADETDVTDDLHEEPVAARPLTRLAATLDEPAPAPRSDLVKHLSSLHAPRADEADEEETEAEIEETVAASGTDEAEAATPAPAAAASTEPVNRGTLLKFLSSVRT